MAQIFLDEKGYLLIIERSFQAKGGVLGSSSRVAETFRTSWLF